MLKPTSFALLLFIFNLSPSFGQETSINYELNGRPNNAAIASDLSLSQNPLKKFIGEWKLVNDDWEHNWGGTTESIKIPKHHTISAQLNTEHSMLSIVDGPEPNGHILWTYSPTTNEVFHLSSFGSKRVGEGRGSVNENGDLQLKISFKDESPGSYRKYSYTWLNENEYLLKSVQYNANDEKTGLFYTGTFVRLTPKNSVELEIKQILKALDDYELPIDEQIEVFAKNVIHMAPNQERIVGKDDLAIYLKQQRSFGRTVMKHEIMEWEDYGNVVIMSGKVNGTFIPADGQESFSFATKNMLSFIREDGKLKISRVIYNLHPARNNKD